MSPSNMRADTSHLNRSTKALLETPKRGGSSGWLTTVPFAVASAVEREGTQAFADPGSTARASPRSASYVSGVAAANASHGFTVTKEQVHRVDSQSKSIQAESKTRRFLSERKQAISDEQITELLAEVKKAGIAKKGILTDDEFRRILAGVTQSDSA